MKPQLQEYIDEFNNGEIEDLLGNEVQKINVPEIFGKTPEYNPLKKIQQNKRRGYSKNRIFKN